ncbi:EAL and HDOD domain-containing protein [Silvibacterium sp.]|uniref:EAL and HDOD domain-containing protein n=1 Tax=Silvibacterium sp. TaxID=1964179 RepID=UPI0039E6A093
MHLGILSSIWRRQQDREEQTAAVRATPLKVPGLNAGLDSSTDAGTTRRFVARQSILDRERRVFGYELLFRSGWANSFSGDLNDATRKMIADGALYGFHDLTHGTPAFVNCTHESLVNGLVTLLPRTTVLEILETVPGDRQVLEACMRYKAMGYRLALDDFRMSEGMHGLIALADFIKVDFTLSDARERRHIFASLKGLNVTMLAEKIETQAQFSSALDEGFSLFQGYFFCRPTMFSKRRMPTNGANYLYLLSALCQGDFHISRIALLLRSEVSLSYQLLQLVNSAGYGVNREVRSLEDALMLAGEDQFRKLLINAIATESCRNRCSELLIQVLHRAQFLEMMAEWTHEDPAEQYLLGLLSLMDVLLDQPVEDLLLELPLRRELRAALRGDPHPAGTALRLFEHYRDTDWMYCLKECASLGLREEMLSDIYRQSLMWAEKSSTLEPPPVYAAS